MHRPYRRASSRVQSVAGLSKAALAAATIAALAACTSGPSRSAEPMLETREVVYSAGDLELTGYVARPEGVTDAPGVLIVHEWWGHNDYVRRRARELAELGYVAFALDMYGTGKTASHPEDATKFMTEVMGNREAMEARFAAGLAVLQAEPGVDTSRTGAIGYCMGGAIALRMAGSTDDIDAVASFHGALEPVFGTGGAGGPSHVLVATGASDPFVPAQHVDQLEEEMKDWRDLRQAQFMRLEGALHGFTNPGATAFGESFDLPLRYDAVADRKSWAAMVELFDDAFSR